jgi:M6 family metalloprotease-like protein
VQHAAPPLPRGRLVGVALITGLALALAASLQPGRASAASGCSLQARTAHAVSLRVFEHGMKRSRAAFFRGHRKLRARRAFVAGQRKRLAQLRREVARCSTSRTSGLPDGNPDPAPPPCSPSLYAAPNTEMNEGTTNARLPLRPGAEIPAVMLFVDFSDLHATESTSALYDRLVPHSKDWYEEVSYGRVHLNVTALQHWLRMPRSLSAYGLGDGISWPEHRDYIADAVAAADREVDFSRYQVVYVVAAKGTHVERSPAFQAYPGSGIEADGAELRYGATFFDDTRSDARYAANVFIHETGHILGLPDLYDIPNPTYWSLFRYAGGWDTMSWNSPGRHFLAWEKWKLGWLEPSQLTCVEGPGELTTTLTPLERRGGLKAIVVPTGLSSAFVVEARRRIGEDAGLCAEGVLVYSVDATVRSGYGPVRVYAAQHDTNGELRDRCGPLYNAPFARTSGEVARFDEPSAGLAVQVLSSGKSGYRVRVTRTSLAPQGVQEPLMRGDGSQASLAPPQPPYLAASFLLGLDWGLSFPMAD